MHTHFVLVGSCLQQGAFGLQLTHNPSLSHSKRQDETVPRSNLSEPQHIAQSTETMGSSTDSVTSSQLAQLSPDARALLSKMSPADRLVLLGAQNTTSTEPTSKEERRRAFHKSSDGVPSRREKQSRRDSTTKKDVKIVLEVPIESNTYNVDETERTDSSDNVKEVPAGAPARRGVRRHVSSDGIPSRTSQHRGVRRHASNDGLAPVQAAPVAKENIKSPTRAKRGVRRHASSDGIPASRTTKASFVLKCDVSSDKKKKKGKASKKYDDDVDNGSYKNFR